MTDEELLEMARLSLLAERHQDMVDYMSQYVEGITGGLSLVELKLLDTAFKRLTLPIRFARKALDMAGAEGYKKQVEGELETACNRLMELLDIGPTPDDVCAAVLILLMRADYARYAAFLKEAETEHRIEMASRLYSQAACLSEALDPCHPLRLEVALNYSVFLCEAVGRQDLAVKMAHRTVKSAIRSLDDAPDKSFLLVYFLSENLASWSGDKKET